MWFTSLLFIFFLWAKLIDKLFNWASRLFFWLLLFLLLFTLTITTRTTIRGRVMMFVMVLSFFVMFIFLCLGLRLSWDLLLIIIWGSCWCWRRLGLLCWSSRDWCLNWSSLDWLSLSWGSLYWGSNWSNLYWSGFSWGSLYWSSNWYFYWFRWFSWDRWCLFWFLLISFYWSSWCRLSWFLLFWLWRCNILINFLQSLVYSSFILSGCFFSFSLYISWIYSNTASFKFHISFRIHCSIN